MGCIDVARVRGGVERDVEADQERLVCEGDCPDRVAGELVGFARRVAARGDGFVSDSEDGGAGRDPADGVSGRSDRYVRSNRGAVSGAGAAFDGDDRVGGAVLEGEAVAGAVTDREKG